MSAMKWFWDSKLNCYCAEHNPTIRADKNMNVFGGGTTKIEQPAAPAAPTVTSSLQDYITNYPQLFQLMQQYAPQEAQMNVDLTKQYAGDMGMALKTAQEAAYPEETKINNLLNAQVQEGMGSEIPQWMQDQYRSNMNAQLGNNVASPIGADYMSRGLLQQNQDWKQYYTNLGLSITGRQPVYQANTPSYTNQLGNYTPTSVMNYNQGIYGTQAGMYNSQLNSATQMASQGNPWTNALGGIAGMGIGSFMGGWGGAAGTKFGGG